LVGHSGADDLVNTIVSIDTNNDSEERHHLTRRPQCPACGAATLYSAQCSPSCTLRGRLTRFTDGGAYRARSSEETLVDWECLSDPLVGVVHDLKPLPMDDAVSSHVYVSRYGSDPAWGVPRLLESGLERASGKGWRDAQARVSAIGEAIERYSAVFQGDEPRIIASLEQLDESAIHPNLCTLFSQTQYESREEWNRRHPERHRVPLPLDPTTRIEWTPVWSLSREKRRYLPTMLLYSGYPDQQGLAFCPADPNGGAAGNSREEALLQGVLELIERDSLALWWYNRVSRPEVDLAAIGHELPVSLIERYRSRGRDLWVLDLTSDLEIPCFAAVSRRTDFWREAIVLGFGAHLDASIAFTRALLELDQVLAHVRAAERSGALSRTLDQWLRDATVANQPYLVPAALPRTRLDELPRLAADDVAENIEICERLLKRHELELFVLDQTRPDIGVPVMKAVVPGLRPFQARFAQGRLYTAPVRSGWLAQARQEDEMNPIGFFL
jgi:ribosomal protein S12 methylthiotransferase accessory factor